MIKNRLIFILSINLMLVITACSYISSTLFYKDPLTAVEHNNLGVAYEKEGKFELAEREYKMAIDKDSDFTVSIINLGNVYFAQGKLKKAERNYREALDIDPGNINATNNLANLYLEAGKELDTAIELMKRNMSTPDEMPAYYLDTLGQLYVETGEHSKGIDMLKMACTKTEEQSLKESIDKMLIELKAGRCI